MLLPFRIASNSHRRNQKTSSNLRRNQMTSEEHNPVVDAVTETIADSVSHAHSANKPVKQTN